MSSERSGLRPSPGDSSIHIRVVAARERPVRAVNVAEGCIRAAEHRVVILALRVQSMTFTAEQSGSS
jgi:hypothetical protein